MNLRRSVSGCVVAVMLLAAACGDAETAAVGEQGDQTPTSADTEQGATEVFAPSTSAAIDAMYASIVPLAEAYVSSHSGGPDQVTAEIALWTSVSGVIANTLDELPAAPSDEALADAYEAMVAALEGWRSAASDAAEALTGSEGELAAGWGSEETAASFAATVDAIVAARSQFEDRCLDVADLVASEAGISINCLGLSTEEPSTDAMGGSVLGLEIVLPDDGSLLKEQVAPGTVDIVAADSEELSLRIIAAPSFADPAEQLDGLQVSGNLPWPEDMVAWIDSVGGIVVAQGETSVGGFDAAYWDVTTTLEKAEALTGGQPAVAVISTGDSGVADTVQLTDTFVVRIVRIQVDPTTQRLAVAMGVNADAPEAEDFPPFIPRSDEAFAWAEMVFGTIVLM